MQLLLLCHKAYQLPICKLKEVMRLFWVFLFFLLAELHTPSTQILHCYHLLLSPTKIIHIKL